MTATTALVGSYTYWLAKGVPDVVLEEAGENVAFCVAGADMVPVAVSVAVGDGDSVNDADADCVPVEETEGDWVAVREVETDVVARIMYSKSTDKSYEHAAVVNPDGWQSHSAHGVNCAKRGEWSPSISVVTATRGVNTAIAMERDVASMNR
jgi:hypothetical protein